MSNPVIREITEKRKKNIRKRLEDVDKKKRKTQKEIINLKRERHLIDLELTKSIKHKDVIGQKRWLRQYNRKTKNIEKLKDKLDNYNLRIIRILS